MSKSLCSRHLAKLSFLGPTSYGQVTRYLELLDARHYASSTLISITEAIRRFTMYLPETRRALVAQHLSQATARDIDLFVEAVRTKGLSPSTINTTLSLIKEFFDYLREEGETQIQPVIRRRHRVFAPSNLPKPMAEADLVAFFKAIDSIRDRAIFLLMLRGGLRVSEVSALTWDDVDFQAGSLRINDG
jgi:site-specific recombinase XerD